MLTRGMCVELARYNIQVNGIAPGYFKTEMTQALADDPAFTARLTQRTPAALGRSAGADRRGGVHGRRRLRLRQRAAAVCRWRHVGGGVTFFVES